METNKRITILSPTYNEEENIEELISRIEKVFSLKLINYEYEIIFIDNSSTDKTVDVIKNKINHTQLSPPFLGLLHQTSSPKVSSFLYNC